MELHFSFDMFPLLYTFLAIFMWIMCYLFIPQYFKGEKKLRFLIFFSATLPFVAGVFLAKDLLTLFLCFEGMTFTSSLLVAENETKEALNATKTYLTIALVGGFIMLMGLFLLYHAVSTLTISDLPEAVKRFLEGDTSVANIRDRRSYLYASGVLIAIGFAAKAGIFPLHIWLPQAHPAAPAPASAILSGMLTKCGIFGILIVTTKILFSYREFSELLLFSGVITMLLGAVLAILSVDLKRILACSSVSQIGFITVGISVFSLSDGSELLSLYGALYHCVNHSILKLVLFLFSGVIYMNQHTLNLNELKGTGRKHPLLMLCVGAAGLSLAGFPGTNGYLSKTLLHEGILSCKEQMKLIGDSRMISILSATEILFLITGGLTLAYMLKIFVAIFLQKGSNEMKKRCMSLSSTLAVFLPALLIPLLGLTPDKLFIKFGKAGERFFLGSETISKKLLTWTSISCLKGVCLSFLFGIMFYLLSRLLLCNKKSEYVNRQPVFLDLDKYFYRPILSFLIFLISFLCRVCDTMVDGIATFFKATIFSPKKRRMSIFVGTKLTHLIGTFLDMLVFLLNKTLFHHHPIKKSFVSVLAVSEKEAKQTLNLITGSVSFGLLLAAFGLVLTLLSLLL